MMKVTFTVDNSHRTQRQISSRLETLLLDDVCDCENRKGSSCSGNVEAGVPAMGFLRRCFCLGRRTTRVSVCQGWPAPPLPNHDSISTVIAEIAPRVQKRIFK